ncbi:RNA-directed DNA polymerase, eukaryota, reverse transcriptase zinc-binding domain protein [Tanacetum coccineum]
MYCEVAPRCCIPLRIAVWGVTIKECLDMVLEDEVGESENRQGQKSDLAGVRCASSNGDILFSTVSPLGTINANKIDNHYDNTENNIKDNGDEVVIFDEVIVEEGSKKWINTLCGYFVGCNISPVELRYNIRRMWGKFGLYDIISNENNVWPFKFRHKEDLDTIVDQSPWLVNVLRGFTVLSSRLGKPLVLDNMIASMCHNSTGRAAYARVMVEIDAMKGFKDSIEVQYRDKNDCVIRTKFVKVEYSWKPVICSLCCVFGHSNFSCQKHRVNKVQQDENKGQNKNHDSEGFVEVKGRKNGFNGYGHYKGKDQINDNVPKAIKEKVNDKVQYKYMPKVDVKKKQDGPVIDKQKTNVQFNTPMQNNRMRNDSPSKKIWNVGTKNVEELKRSANKYVALADDEGNEEVNEVIKDRRLEVDKWKEVCRNEYENKIESEGDIACEENEVARKLVVDEIDGVDTWENLMIVHISKQDILCVVESAQRNIKFFCSFIYAGNFGGKDKIYGKICKSIMNGDMVDFNECVNKELEDICSIDFQFTWTKSLKNHNSSIMKKLDRIMINEGFCSNTRILLIEVEKDPFNCDLKERVVKVLNEYVEVSNDELKLLQQKARIKWLSKGDQNTSYFHGILKLRKYKRRIESICDESGTRFDGDNVADAFVEHFKKFLGTKQVVQPLNSIEINFERVSSEDEVENMISMVTSDEIKEAIFDIDSNKAVGPDGYTSGFLKKAWIIIGKEVCLAIRDFFINGKLLGKINVTMIAQVPKLEVPNKVSEFRPIACCNVIYKSIIKILTNRIKNGLQKVVNMNQSAFIPSGHIQDNILIAQELLKGYKRKNSARRCAIKINIQKAYDTFSICINGEAHVYFQGGRGLRQGDPISPYLYTLVIEVFSLLLAKKIQNANKFKVHYGCKTLQLSNMCFVEDLLVWCNEDVESVGVIKKSMDQVSSISSLFPNMGKRVPLVAKKLGIHDCKSLVDKVGDKINCCKNKVPTYAGRIQLIASVLSSMQLLELRSRIKNHGNGKNVSMWFDRWDIKGPLFDIIPKIVWYEERYSDNEKVVDMIDRGVWIWPARWHNRFPKLCNINVPILSNGVTDKVLWLDNQNKKKEFSTKQAWCDLRDNVLAIMERLATQDRLAKWNCHSNFECPLCKKERDSHGHLFFKCDFFKAGLGDAKEEIDEYE